MTISLILLLVLLPPPCLRIINTESGVETPDSVTRLTRSSPFVCLSVPSPGVRVLLVPPGRVLIEIYGWRCLLRRVTGYPHSLHSDISIMPQIVIVTLGREQTTHSSSPRSHNVNQDKLIALGIVSDTGHESPLRVCLSRVQSRPTDLQEMIWRIQTHP